MSDTKGASQSQTQQINVSDLDLTQLADVKRQLDEELEHLTNSFAQLRAAQAKFKSCIDNIAEIKPENANRTTLVPLTNSLYVPGKLSDAEHVIVDVGTGYYIKKSRAQATKYYRQKVDFVRSNLDTLQDALQKKQDNLSYVVNLMQAKINAQNQSGQGQSGHGQSGQGQGSTSGKS